MSKLQLKTHCLSLIEWFCSSYIFKQFGNKYSSKDIFFWLWSSQNALTSMIVKTKKNLCLYKSDIEKWSNLIYSSCKQFCKMYSISIYIYKPSAMKWNKIDCIIVHFKLVCILFFLVSQVIQVNSIWLPSIIWWIQIIFLSLSENKSSF